jgi:hypothetical protein
VTHLRATLCKKDVSSADFVSGREFGKLRCMAVWMVTWWMLLVFIATINKIGLVQTVKAVRYETQAKHKKNQSDNGKRNGSEKEANSTQCSIGDTEDLTVLLPFFTLE